MSPTKDLGQDGGQDLPDSVGTIRALVIVFLRYMRVLINLDTITEVTNAVIALCLERYGRGILDDFSHTKMGTEGHLAAKNRIIPVVRQVVDQFRKANSHKIEVKPGTTLWDPSRDPSKRQRRVVHETQLPADALIPSRGNEVENQVDLSLDLATAIEQLPDDARTVAVAKIKGQTWAEIAKQQNLTVNQVKSLWTVARVTLVEVLKAYLTERP